MPQPLGLSDPVAGAEPYEGLWLVLQPVTEALFGQSQGSWPATDPKVVNGSRYEMSAEEALLAEDLALAEQTEEEIRLYPFSPLYSEESLQLLCTQRIQSNNKNAIFRALVRIHKVKNRTQRSMESWNFNGKKKQAKKRFAF